jgi:hypothetical protein
LKRIENQEESGENLQNQLLNSGEFSSGERFEKQKTPDQIRRFDNPAHGTMLITFFSSASSSSFSF